MSPGSAEKKQAIPSAPDGFGGGARESQQGKSLSFGEVITRYSEVRAGRIVQSMDELTRHISLVFESFR
jgi:hypothetical protein